MFLQSIMEKDIGKIKKNEIIDIIIRIDDFGGRPGLTIREFTTSERYTGFTKSGTRIPVDSFQEFKQMINSIDESDFPAQSAPTKPQEPSESKPEDKEQQTINKSSEESSSEQTNNPKEIKEEVY